MKFIIQMNIFKYVYPCTFLLLLVFFLSQCQLPNSEQELYGLWLGVHLEYQPNLPQPVLNEYRADGMVTAKRIGKEEKVYPWSLNGNILSVDTIDYDLLALSDDSLLSANNYRFLFRRAKDAPIEKTTEELRAYIENASWIDGQYKFHFDVEKLITEDGQGAINMRCWNIEKYGQYAFLYQNGYWENCNLDQSARVMQITKAAENQLNFSIWNETGKRELSCAKSTDKPNFEILKKERTFQRCHVYGLRGNLPAGKNYEGGGKAIEDYFYTHYKAPKGVKESGFITLRFVINCEGASGEFETLEMDANYKSYNFVPGISEQLMQLAKKMDKWIPLELDGQVYDERKIITFSIQKGAIKAIML